MSVTVQGLPEEAVAKSGSVVVDASPEDFIRFFPDFFLFFFCPRIFIFFCNFFSVLDAIPEGTLSGLFRGLFLPDFLLFSTDFYCSVTFPFVVRTLLFYPTFISLFFYSYLFISLFFLHLPLSLPLQPSRRQRKTIIFHY